MVDAIGIRTRSVARIAPTVPVPAARAATEPAVQATAPAPAVSLVQSLAAKPPVDLDRVAEIKKAIATGKFPLLPSTIADRLIALKLEWNPNDKA